MDQADPIDPLYPYSPYGPQRPLGPQQPPGSENIAYASGGIPVVVEDPAAASEAVDGLLVPPSDVRGGRREGGAVS